MRQTILIVDDHAAYRRSARALLEAEGFEVVGEAADGYSAISQVATLHPRIVLLDIQLPDMDGFAVARQLAAAPDPPAVILTSTRDARDYRRRLISSPALGFVPKGELTAEVLAGLVA